MKIKYNKDLDKHKYAKVLASTISDTKKLISLMKLSDWRFTIRFELEKELGKDDLKEIPTAAETDTEYQYKVADIKYYIKTIHESQSEKEQRDTVIHEMCHVLISAYTNMVFQMSTKNQEAICDFAEEMTVSHMAGLPFWQELLEED